MYFTNHLLSINEVIWIFYRRCDSEHYGLQTLHHECWARPGRHGAHESAAGCGDSGSLGLCSTHGDNTGNTTGELVTVTGTEMRRDEDLRSIRQVPHQQNFTVSRHAAFQKLTIIIKTRFKKSLASTRKEDEDTNVAEANSLTLLDLPEDILAVIFEYLDVLDIMRYCAALLLNCILLPFDVQLRSGVNENEIYYSSLQYLQEDFG